MNDYDLILRVQDAKLSKGERFLVDNFLNKLRSYNGARLSDEQRQTALELLNR